MKLLTRYDQHDALSSVVTPPSKLLYAQVREDTEIDIEALAIRPEDRVLAVTSGGCTALRLLAEGPQELTCVDLNPAQNHLLELKLAAIRLLPLAQCRRFLGARKCSDRMETFLSLSDALSPAARTFWASNPSLIQNGVIYAGTTEKISAWMRKVLFGYVHNPWVLRQLLRQRDRTTQETFYREVWANRRWRAILWLAFHPFVFHLIYGKRFTQRLGSQKLSDLWMQKIERAIASSSMRSNYFVSQLFWRSFPPGEEGLPPYLQERYFERIRANVGRIRWLTGEIATVLERGPSGAYTKATLSNAFEWIPQSHLRQAFAALGHALAPGGRAVLRHFLGVARLPPELPLTELTELSDYLTQKEKAFLYTHVSVVERSMDRLPVSGSEETLA